MTFFETFSKVIGARNDKGQIVSLLDNLTQPSVANAAGLQAVSIKGLLKGLEKSEGSDTSLKEKLKSISSEAGSNTTKAIQDLKGLYAK